MRYQKLISEIISGEVSFDSSGKSHYGDAFLEKTQRDTIQKQEILTTSQKVFERSGDTFEYNVSLPLAEVFHRPEVVSPHSSSVSILFHQ